MLPGIGYQLAWWTFALIAVLGAILVVTRRNPVHSAMFLVLTLFASSGLYVLLHAHFIAAVQVLVYAGAIMVFFVFVIMLLNLGDRELRAGRYTVAKGLALAALVVLGWVLIGQIRTLPGGAEDVALRLGAWYPERVPPLPSPRYGTAESIGRKLLTGYLLPFEIASIFLLAAMVAAVVIGRRHEPGDQPGVKPMEAGLIATPRIVIEEEEAERRRRVA